MKTIAIFKPIFFTLFLALFFSSCIIIDDDPPPVPYGPRGYDGLAFFGVDYDQYHPYSYWDNNPALPFNPELGVYFQTNPGIYDFEYFINRHEYWYGTYQIWINPGGPGRPNGVPGYDGLDSYLMLICNPNGYYEYRNNFKNQDYSVEPLIIERKDGNKNFKITLYKGDVNKRPPQTPKYKMD